eukprot:GHVS01102893.1.p1 GENE.GHVS01102893.1~~GHVS01102893.1.p1  ORF type:complete len:360 (+),score=52.27 GHVS01102893.1:118-1197(+)
MMVARVCQGSFLHRKLVCLECPLLFLGEAGEEALVLEEGTKFRQLVVWLEESKLRFYTRAERKLLRDIHSQSWWKTFYKYCADLGVVFGNDEIPGSAPRCLLAADKLSSIALQDQYLDNAERLTHQQPKGGSPCGGRPEEEEVGLQRLHPHVGAMLSVLCLPPLPDKPSDQCLAAALKCVRVRLEKREDPAECAPTSLAVIPAGLPTKIGADLRDAVAVLRLLHNHELRLLQCFINSSISSLQEITGDPKTDTRLVVRERESTSGGRGETCRFGCVEWAAWADENTTDEDWKHIKRLCTKPCIKRNLPRPPPPTQTALFFGKCDVHISKFILISGFPDHPHSYLHTSMSLRTTMFSRNM